MNYVASHFFRKKSIAVIGTGIAGLSAAWLLSKRHNVTVYETADRPGGHANTVDIEIEGKTIPVDTGFIVYNNENYPNLVALFEHLGTATHESKMSFAASLDGGDFEYCSEKGLPGIFAHGRNTFKPRAWRMLLDILKLYRSAHKIVEKPEWENATLGEFLDAFGYSETFCNDHILPMCAAIWSCPPQAMKDYSLKSFIGFFHNHGLLKVTNRPNWRTVTGGSREYIKKLVADTKADFLLGRKVTKIRRGPHGVSVLDATGEERAYDDVVIASHADQALSLLGDAHDLERKVLGSFPYQANSAWLHTDVALMSKNKRVWSSWNYIGGDVDDQEHVTLTYWMNMLQGLDAETPVLVTLNPESPPKSDSVFETFTYDHPIFHQDALAAQKRLWEIQGRDRTWFCGSYFGFGFHEDALQSGLAVAEALGGVARPWRVENQNGRISWQPQTLAEQAA